MNECTHIGLDVHKDTIAVAVLRPGITDCDERVIPNTPEAVRRLLSRYPDPSQLSTCYEAGPTGYDTHRLITSLGIACDVIAPSLIPKRSGVRVKTDRIDARNLARLHRAGAAPERRRASMPRTRSFSSCSSSSSSHRLIGLLVFESTLSSRWPNLLSPGADTRRPTQRRRPGTPLPATQPPLARTPVGPDGSAPPPPGGFALIG